MPLYVFSLARIFPYMEESKMKPVFWHILHGRAWLKRKVLRSTVSLGFKIAVERSPTQNLPCFNWLSHYFQGLSFDLRKLWSWILSISLKGSFIWLVVYIFVPFWLKFDNAGRIWVVYQQIFYVGKTSLATLILRYCNFN